MVTEQQRKRRCSRCIYRGVGIKSDGEQASICRRYAPHAGSPAAWAVIDLQEDWCGDFKDEDE